MFQNLLLTYSTPILGRIEGEFWLNTAMDGGGSTQQRVCPANSKLKNVQGCTFFTVPPLYFCSRLVSSTAIFKGLRQMVFQDGQGCPWFRAATSLPANLQPKNVHGCTFFTVPAVNLCSRLVVSKPPRMAVVPRSSEFFTRKTRR